MSALGLADYGSSDDEEDRGITDQNKTQSGKAIHERLEDQHNPDLTIHETTTIPGPTLPSDVVGTETNGGSDTPATDRELSPYSSQRQQTRLLTMPPVPNFDIPPSPPPSDDPEMAVTNKKIAQFLELKRQGVHFNQRLLSSSALRNPGMVDKLLSFADIEGAVQYQSALPEGLAIDVERWSSLRVEEIVGEMEDRRRREAEGRKGTKRDFVPAGKESREDGRKRQR